MSETSRQASREAFGIDNEHVRLVQAARTEAQSGRRGPRVDNVEGKGAVVVSITSRREITAQPFDPEHDPASHERAEASETQKAVENIDTMTQAHIGYRNAFRRPSMFDDSQPEHTAPYLEKKAS